MSYTQFIAVDFCAAIISVPIWVYLGDYCAKNLEWLEHQVKNGQHIIFSVLGVLALYFGWKWYRNRKNKSA